MYNLMFVCIVLIVIIFITYVAITIYEICTEKRGRKNADGKISDGKNGKEVCVINTAEGGRISISICADMPDCENRSSAEKAKSETVLDLYKTDPADSADSKKLCSVCVNPYGEVAITDNKSAYKTKNVYDTQNKVTETEKKFNSEYLILPEEYYRLSVTECYFYDEIVRFAYKCGANGRYRRENGEEIRRGNMKMAELRIIGGEVYCALSGEAKPGKVGTFQNLQKIKTSMESIFA